MIYKLSCWVWAGAWALAFVAGTVNVVGLLGFEHQVVTHLITSKNETVESLLEARRRMQRLFLKVRKHNVGLHPMTQILEETSTRQTFHKSIGLDERIQFILRVGYLNNYPAPVSLRLPVSWFLRS